MKGKYRTRAEAAQVRNEVWSPDSLATAEGYAPLRPLYVLTPEQVALVERGR
ncbi:MAG: hypothetical protein KA249_12160 [Dermatophilaceae bacterium]|nr:hypothetical protein [Dermatophilaceae bacterium]